MKALVIYDSMFGNTEQVAQTIGQALLSEGHEVQTLRVTQVSPQQATEVDVLLVGSPTRAFRPTPATVQFLKDIPDNGLQGIKVGAFDTRIAPEDTGSRLLSVLVRLFGYAAEPMAKRLRQKGGAQALSPEGFIVTGKEGPLREGELERAAGWAKGIFRAA
jgi:flavodoxin I